MGYKIDLFSLDFLNAILYAFIISAICATYFAHHMLFYFITEIFFFYTCPNGSGVKRPGSVADQAPSSGSRFKMRGSTPPSSHTSSWHDAYLIMYRNVFDFQAKQC